MKQGKANLIALATELERQRGAKIDVMADTRQLTVQVVAPANEITPNAKAGNSVLLPRVEIAIQAPPSKGGGTYPVNDTFYRQLGERNGVPGKYMDRMLAEAPALFTHTMNHWLHEQPSRRLVRLLDGSARALLSDRYQRIDNADVAEIAIPALEAAGAEVVSCEVTERRLYIKAVTHKVRGEVKRDDVVEAGVEVGNSEIGYGAIYAVPFAMRLACLNGMKIDVGGFRRAHIGTRQEMDDNTVAMLTDETIQADDNAILLKARDVIAASLSQASLDAYIERAAVAAGSASIVSETKAVEVLTKTYRLTDKEGDGVLKALIRGGDLSRWGMANAITQYAQADEVTYDRASELETLGGTVMTTAGAAWEAMRAAA